MKFYLEGVRVAHAVLNQHTGRVIFSDHKMTEVRIEDLKVSDFAKKDVLFVARDTPICEALKVWCNGYQ